jgi:hypothetical protein
MKIDKLRQRLRSERPRVNLSVSLPEDVIEDLKDVAPKLGFSNYLALVRAYICQGLRLDLDKLDAHPLSSLVESLRQQGVSDEVIAIAVAEFRNVTHLEAMTGISDEVITTREQLHHVPPITLPVQKIG